MSDYVVECTRKYQAPSIDPAQDCDEYWTTRKPYKFVDIEWFIDACLKYPRAAVDYGLSKNTPRFIHCFYPRDVSLVEDYETDGEGN